MNQKQVLELGHGVKRIADDATSRIHSPTDPEVKEQLVELKYLEHTIKPTGKLTMKPFLKFSSRKLGELLMLSQQ